MKKKSHPPATGMPVCECDRNMPKTEEGGKSLKRIGNYRGREVVFEVRELRDIPGVTHEILVAGKPYAIFAPDGDCPTTYFVSIVSRNPFGVKIDGGVLGHSLEPKDRVWAYLAEMWFFEPR